MYIRKHAVEQVHILRDTGDLAGMAGIHHQGTVQSLRVDPLRLESLLFSCPRYEHDSTRPVRKPGIGTVNLENVLSLSYL